MSRFDLRITLALFAALASVYFATITGITSSNDGSHYALVRALVDHRSFEITPYLTFTEDQDYAFSGTGENTSYFTDRPPGTGLVASVMYTLGQVMPRPLAEVPTKHDVGNPRVIYAVWTASLAAAASVSLLYLTLRRFFGRGIEAALAASVALGLGTMLWKYGSVLFSHALAALTLMLALYLTLLITTSDDAPTLRTAALLGFVLGFAPVVEYTSLPFSVLVGIYLVLMCFRRIQQSDRRDQWLKAIGALVLAGLIPAVFLAAYNTTSFGGPLEISRFNANIELWPENENVATTFSTPILYGLRAVLWHVPTDPNRGLFHLAPVALFGLAGLPALFRFDWRKASLVVGLFAVHLLMFASTTTFNPGTNDSRYLTTFLGLWFVAVAFGYDAIGSYGKRTAELRNSRLVPFPPPSGGRVSEGREGVTIVLRTIWLTLFWLAVVFSIITQMLHIATSWNYDLDPALSAPTFSFVGVLVRTLFRNAGNLPVLWGMFALAYIFMVLLRRSQSRRTRPVLSSEH